MKKYTHANLKTPVYIDLALVFAAYYSEGSKSTHVVATGGAVLPISESPEQINQDKAGEGSIPPARKRSKLK